MNLGKYIISCFCNLCWSY